MTTKENGNETVTGEAILMTDVPFTLMTKDNSVMVMMLKDGTTIVLRCQKANTPLHGCTIKTDQSIILVTVSL